MENDENPCPEKTVEEAEDRDGSANKKDKVDGIERSGGSTSERDVEEDQTMSSGNKEDVDRSIHERDSERGTSYTFTPTSCLPDPATNSTDTDDVCFSEEGPTAKSKFRRNRGTSSPYTFMPREGELVALRKHIHDEHELLTRLEPRLLKIVQRRSVDLPTELDPFFDLLDDNLYLNFSVEEAVGQNWSGEEKEWERKKKKKKNRDRLEKSEVNGKQGVDEDGMKGDKCRKRSHGEEENGDKPIHENEKDSHVEEERESKRSKRSSSEIHVEKAPPIVLNVWEDLDPYLQDPVASSCSTYRRAVPSFPSHLLPPPAPIKPSGVDYQMKKFLAKKARSIPNVIANQSRCESTGSKPVQTCPHATRQPEPQQSSSVNQPQQYMGYEFDYTYEPEFVETIKRNKRKVEFDGINVVMDQQHERRQVLKAVTAYIEKVAPIRQPEASISAQEQTSSSATLRSSI
ncbi:hypothetical protein LINPERPRIM_LOCUS39716 [Linum perenne]